MTNEADYFVTRLGMTVEERGEALYRQLVLGQLLKIAMAYAAEDSRFQSRYGVTLAERTEEKISDWLGVTDLDTFLIEEMKRIDPTSAFAFESLYEELQTRREAEDLAGRLAGKPEVAQYN